MSPSPDTSSRGWRFVFGGLLVLAMAAATQIPAGLGVVATFVRDDLDVTRTQIGALITTTIIVAALLSPLAGRITDVLGGRRSMVVLFSTVSVAYLGIVGVPGYWILFVPAAIAGITQAAGNPTTNKLIALHAAPGRRGVITGIKQSGVQAGVFTSGIVMPGVAAAWGWRWAFGVMLIIPLLGLVGTLLTIPQDGGSRESQRAIEAAAGSLPRAIPFLTVYGGLMGFGASFIFLVPLFAEEALGYSEQAAGLAAGMVGLVALLARIGWARHVDRSGRHDPALVDLAVISVAASTVFLVSQWGASWLLWVAVVLTGLSSAAWNSVGMLAVIEHAGHERSGRASGIVMFGFLTGLAAGPTLFGWLVDITDSYTVMWIASIGVLGVAALLAMWWVRRGRWGTGTGQAAK